MSQDWVFRVGFKTRSIKILKWIVLGNFLTFGYMSTLLSQLVAIRYENPIDTIGDMDKSGLSLLIPRGAAIEYLIGEDPRPAVQRIFNRSMIFSYNGSHYPPFIDDM